MPSNFTEHYQLNQWEPTDKIQRADFNADNAKTDAALAGLEARKADKADIVAGSYTGDGQEFRTISIGFTPKAVLLFGMSGRTHDGTECHGGLALPGNPVFYSNICLKIVDGGFNVYFGDSGMRRTNNLGEKYGYLALR